MLVAVRAYPTSPPRWASPTGFRRELRFAGDHWLRELLAPQTIEEDRRHVQDDQTEYQLRDRLSFMRFAGLALQKSVPDKTIWLGPDGVHVVDGGTYRDVHSDSEVSTICV